MASSEYTEASEGDNDEDYDPYDVCMYVRMFVRMFVCVCILHSTAVTQF